MNDWDKLMDPTREALEALIAKGDEMADRIEELEAKLAKAVEALELYSCEDGCNDCPEHERDRVGCGWTARATLAAIKAADLGVR